MRKRELSRYSAASDPNSGWFQALPAKRESVKAKGCWVSICMPSCAHSPPYCVCRPSRTELSTWNQLSVFLPWNHGLWRAQVRNCSRAARAPKGMLAEKKAVKGGALVIFWVSAI
ncbi:hypothetical protein D3C85_1366880 [compost metagenome]